jgi:phosphate transport system protein
MGIKKQKAFTQLQTDFDAYANKVVKQLRLLESMLDPDSVATFEKNIAEIKELEKEINTYDLKFSEDIINLIVLYAPVASELRRLMALNRVSLNLEKIGDLVSNITKSIRKIEDPNLLSSYTESLGDIYITSVNMVEKALCAVNYNDMDYAIWTIKNDDLVDELHKSIIKKIIKKKIPFVKTQPELKTFINLINTVKNIERIGDCATNIAEAAIYATLGKDVRHKKVDVDSLIVNRGLRIAENKINEESNGNAKDTDS